MKTMKNLALCLMTVAVLLLQLVSPVPVRADDGTPPRATDTTSGTPTPVPVDTFETTPPVPTQTDVTEEITFFDAAQGIADDTNVVVLDENGGPLPLASQEAADVIATSDPVWCPAGQAPTPGSNGCTTSYTTLADLVANEGGNIAADGTIWMTSGLVPELGKVTIDGLTYTAWSNYAVTLQGGWSGISGDQNIEYYAFFPVPVEIINWNNSVVINNISMESVATLGADWLQVQTNSGDITISNSNISNNLNFSPIISGVRLSAPRNVAINNSRFNHNLGPNLITSANLTIDNSDFTNISLVESAVAFFPSCSPDTVSNVMISNSDFSSTFIGNGFSVIGTCSMNDDPRITIDNSSFNDNVIGAQLTGNNVTINNSTFNNNSVAGVSIFAGNATISNSILSGNKVGAILMGDVTLDHVTIAHNDVGLETDCTWPGTGMRLNHVGFVGNGTDIGNGIIHCDNTMARIISNDSVFMMSSQREGEFTLDCAGVDGYAVDLLRGDLVQIFCPVSGRARISSLSNTALPAPLPAEYSYTSAFSLDILQNETPIQVITEGGYLKTSFAASSLPEENTYSILYWDNGTWVPLKEFTLDENGSFQLNPDASEDPREILSGVKLVANNGSPRVEVSTNFPGIFVLAQH